MEAKHDIIERKMCKEIETIEEKYRANPTAEMTVQDLDRLDKLYHALKSKATYDAMKEANEYEMDNVSERRGRTSSMTGRNSYRDGGDSYTEGYSRGYSEAMSQMSRRPFNY